MPTQEQKTEYIFRKADEAGISSNDLLALIGWIAENWATLDPEEADTYLNEKEEEEKVVAIANAKAQLKKLGEKDAYLDK